MEIQTVRELLHINFSEEPNTTQRIQAHINKKTLSERIILRSLTISSTRAGKASMQVNSTKALRLPQVTADYIC